MTLEEKELRDATSPDDIVIEKSYKGPKITFPITQAQIESLVEAFNANKVSGRKLVLHRWPQILSALSFFVLRIATLEESKSSPKIL